MTTGHQLADPVAPPRARLRGAAMTGAGMALPAHVETSAAISARLGVPANWVEKRTGIVERRLAAPGETLAELAAEAARRTLEAAGVDAVDLVLVATMSPDAITPNVAPVVVGLAGLGDAASMDIGAACTGWLSAVSLAAAEIETGRRDSVLVIGADHMSRIVDPLDRGTAAVFADGAAAVLVSACDGASRIGRVVLGTDPTGASRICTDHDAGVVRMAGGAAFGAAVDRLSEATLAALDASGLALDDVDLFAYHQGNGRILTAVGDRLGLDRSRVLRSLDRYGNTATASIPLTLADAAASGRLQDGARVLMAAFGAGFTYGAAVVEWGAPA